jgi:dihydrofolate reductase
MIEMIWAMDENWLIGQKNTLPWYYPTDTKYFWEMANDRVVVCGRLTYESLLPFLEKRKIRFKKIYVVSKTQQDDERATFIDDLPQLLKNSKDDLLIIGGSKIYEIALPYANRLYITFILKAYQGDSYFPKFNLRDFKLVDKYLEPELIFATYERLES